MMMMMMMMILHLQEGEFNWSESQQGIILAAFFYGYVTTQIPGGMLAQRFGGKRLLLFGIFWTAVLTILTPVITHYGGFLGIVLTRVFEGIGEVRLSGSDCCNLQGHKNHKFISGRGVFFRPFPSCPFPPLPLLSSFLASK